MAHQHSAISKPLHRSSGRRHQVGKHFLRGRPVFNRDYTRGID
jgi:hypothetical protein